MKTTPLIRSVIILCFAICVGCSKDSDIPCGKITKITWSYSGYTYNTLYHLTVELSDGSTRCDTIKTDSFEVGDEYCNATGTCN